MYSVPAMCHAANKGPETEQELCYTTSPRPSLNSRTLTKYLNFENNAHFHPLFQRWMLTFNIIPTKKKKIY